jgi:hypothetical protein
VRLAPDAGEWLVVESIEGRSAPDGAGEWLVVGSIDGRLAGSGNPASSRATVCADVSSGGSGDEGAPGGGVLPLRAIVCAEVRAGVWTACDDDVRCGTSCGDEMRCGAATACGDETRDGAAAE